jgi:FkbH-like protein
MKYFVFRNSTVEPFFKGIDSDFSGYEDISVIDDCADRYIWFYLVPIAENEIITKKMRHYTDLIRMIGSRINSNKLFILFTAKNIFNIQSVSSNRSVACAVHEYNESIYELASVYKNIKVLDFSRFIDNYAINELINWKYYFISQMIIHPRLSIDFQNWFATQISAIELRRKKCLVLDLDNTLWGGILGEDGISGVSLGGDYPGNVYLLFQHQLLSLSREGVILTIDSKNNLEDVRQMWDEHPNVVLKEEHFAAMRINWDNKADNISVIAQKLNINIDSMVFLDDSPAERDLVKKYLPEVIVPDFPEHPYMLLDFLRNIVERYFCIYMITEEDKEKAKQYQANVLRQNMQNSFSNMEDYIRNLNIVLEIAEVNDLTRARVAQMTQKTNQFNLTTHRYTDVDVNNIINDGGMIFTLSVSDKFGDSGITGLCIVNIIENKATIDSFLLSCRVLGKGIEKIFAEYVLKLLQLKGVSEVTALYIPTNKNSLVADFYDKIGFVVVDENKDPIKCYWKDLSKINIELSKDYTIKSDIVFCS